MSRIITFYSYKGGTGRSMALANVAWILASAGKRVLTIDWDLEAPGLHRYFQPFLNDKELGGQESQGVIEMAIDFAAHAATPRNTNESADSNWYVPYADFSKWRQKLRWPSGDAIRLGRQGTGEIDFVPAGRQDAEYGKHVNEFDWHNFYQTLGGGAFFDEARRKLSSYDYVLIDSRTGVSDTSGICTVQLPDILVVCFTLNYQSIKGAFAVAKSVRESRPNIVIYPLATRIDSGETPSLNRMKNYAAELFTPLLDPSIDAKQYWFSIEVPYFTRYAYAEKLALFEQQASITASILPAMERLTTYLSSGTVRSAGPLPDGERKQALIEFEGDLPASPTPAAVSTAADEGYAPIEIFISSDRGDYPLARIIDESLSALSAELFGHIKVFRDVDNVVFGEDFRSQIWERLKKADYLVVLHTSESKSSSYIGFEVGAFQSLIIGEERSGREELSRQIVFLYSDRMPELARGALGINLQIESRYLAGGRDDYIRSVSQPDAPLVQFFSEIGQRTLKRLPRALVDAFGRPGNLDRIVRQDVMPRFGAQLYDIQQSRVASVLNLSCEMMIELPANHRTNHRAIPGIAKVSVSAAAFQMFGIPHLDESNETTWEAFYRLLEAQGNVYAVPAIQSVILGAIHGASANSEVFRTTREQAIRVTVVRVIRYYTGNTTVVINFVETRASLSKERSSSVLIAVITTAAKFRTLVGSDSSLSVEGFRFELDPVRRQEKARQLKMDIETLEREAAESGLNDVSNFGKYFVNDFDSFISSRERLFSSQSRFIAALVDFSNVDPTSSEYEERYKNFQSAYYLFRDDLDRFNSVVTVRAIDNLRKSFEQRPSSSDPAIAP